MKFLFVICGSLMFFVSGARCATAANWPCWRGPDGSGLAPEQGLPEQWGTNRNIAWKVELPGAGWSQPVTWGGKIFLTTAVTDKQRKPRGGEFGMTGMVMPGTADGATSGAATAASGGLTGGPAPSKQYRWLVICLDAASGKVLWQRTAREGKPTIPSHVNNTYASETPVTDGERVIASFGMNGIYCYDLDGKPLWNKDLGAYPMWMGWGSASSPLLYGDRVFIQCDNEKESFLAALDKKTGQELWRVPREEKSNWSTPTIWKNKQRTELIAAGGKKTRAYRPETGELLWEIAGCGRTAITPVGDADLLYIDSYDRTAGRWGVLMAVRAGAAGDISLKYGQRSSAFVAWTAVLTTTRVASPLLYDGCLYQLDEQTGTIRCFDATTGAPNYAEKLPGARGFTASPWTSDGKIFCLDETGLTVVLKPGPKLEVLATSKLDETFWASMAVAGDKLLLRGVDHLYCIAK